MPASPVWQVENLVTSSGRFRPGGLWKTTYTLWTRRTKGTAGGERSQHSETVSAVIFFLGEHCKGLYSSAGKRTEVFLNNNRAHK